MFSSFQYGSLIKIISLLFYLSLSLAGKAKTWSENEDIGAIKIVRRGFGNSFPHNTGQSHPHRTSSPLRSASQAQQGQIHQNTPVSQTEHTPNSMPKGVNPKRQVPPNKAKFDMISTPKGIPNREARNQVLQIQDRISSVGHQVKGQALVKVPSFHESKHDLPRITVHGGRKQGLVHAIFTGPQSPPRQAQVHRQHIPSSLHAQGITSHPIYSSHNAPPSSHTQTANLLDRISGQATQPITQHAGDKRRREGSSKDHVNTDLRLRKRSIKD